MEIHHIGLVVKNINQHFEDYYKNALGYSELSEIFKDEKLGVYIAFINLNDRIFLELVQPINANSPVNNFLNKRGQTLHHLCFEVDNLINECNRLRKYNYFITMEPVPAKAFNGRKVAFLMSKDENHLIELLEKE